MTVDDYPSGLNVRRHQNKLGTAISDSGTGGPRRRQQIGSGARRAGSFLVDLRARMFLTALLAHPIHFSIDVLLLTHDGYPSQREWLAKRIDPVTLRQQPVENPGRVDCPGYIFVAVNPPLETFGCCCYQVTRKGLLLPARRETTPLFGSTSHRLRLRESY